ncbi:MAG: hypothetical protein ACYDC3_05200 [Candidatus Binataceae bacterium]
MGGVSLQLRGVGFEIAVGFLELAILSLELIDAMFEGLDFLPDLLNLAGAAGARIGRDGGTRAARTGEGTGLRDDQGRDNAHDNDGTYECGESPHISN